MTKPSKKIEIKCTSDTYMSFSEMVPFEDNPRELTSGGFKKLKKSITEIGIFKPFLIWKKGNKILGGNQRYAVILKLVEEEGYKVDKLPVTILDVEEGIARLIVLKDNQSDGEWAYEELTEYLQKLEAFGVDKSLSGFTDKEREDLEKLVQTPEQLRESLEKMAQSEDVEEMMSKKFGISFKVPEADWPLFQAAMKKLKAETKTDEVWPNIKLLFKKFDVDQVIETPEGSDFEELTDENDEFDSDLDPVAEEEINEFHDNGFNMEPDLDDEEEEEPPPPPKKAKKKKEAEASL